MKGKSLSRVRLLATPWTAAYQAPPSTGFSRQEYWSAVPLPSCRGRYNSVHNTQLAALFGKEQGRAAGRSEWLPPGTSVTSVVREPL